MRAAGRCGGPDSRSGEGPGRVVRRRRRPIISARNTAMCEAVTDLPPIIVSDMSGVSAGSAHRCARYADDSWADYLAAGADEE